MTRFTEADLELRGFIVYGARAVKAINQAAAKMSKGKYVDADLKRKLLAARGNIEAMFEVQLLDTGLRRQPQFQFRPMDNRKFRVDVAFRRERFEQSEIIFEVQGHVHRIKAQFLRDMERHNTLTQAGWTIYYISGDMVRDGRGVELAKRIIGCR